MGAVDDRDRVAGDPQDRGAVGRVEAGAAPLDRRAGRPPVRLRALVALGRRDYHDAAHRVERQLRERRGARGASRRFRRLALDHARVRLRSPPPTTPTATNSQIQEAPSPRTIRTPPTAQPPPSPGGGAAASGAPASSTSPTPPPPPPPFAPTAPPSGPAACAAPLGSASPGNSGTHRSLVPSGSFWQPRRHVACGVTLPPVH